MALNQTWASRWTATPETNGPLVSQPCGPNTSVLGGHGNFGQGQTLTGVFPLPSLSSERSLAHGHQEVQVAMEIYFLDRYAHDTPAPA